MTNANTFRRIAPALQGLTAFLRRTRTVQGADPAKKETPARLCTPLGCTLPQRHGASRNGVTLLVTLGILTVLSMMVVTFLLSARYQSLSAKHYRNKTVARQALDVVLARAMQFAGDAMIASNYVDVSAGQQGGLRRVYPAGAWFKQSYQPDPSQQVAPGISYQAQDILLVPTLVETAATTNALTVDLLTDEVRRLLPAALNSRLVNPVQPLRSGWIVDLDSGMRASFAVLNCSGFIDAHCYDSASNLLVVTTQTVARTYFSQQDLLSDSYGVAKEFADDPAKAPMNPFSITSYDPDPNVMPLEENGVQTTTNLGTFAFLPLPKFELNSISNYFLSTSELAGMKKRLVVMPRSWFNGVTRLLQSASITNLQDQASFEGRDAYFGEARKVAWNIVNYMTESRIPTAFPETILDPNSNTASRLDYAIEAVPLINEVELKDIFPDPMAATYNVADPMYHTALDRIKQQIEALFFPPEGETEPAALTPVIEWSNIYAFDLELCYPFRPNTAPENAYLWFSVTTNSPSLFSASQAPYAWVDDDYVTLGYVLFSRWNALYESAMSSNSTLTVTNDVVWNVLKTNDVLLAYVENPTAFDGATNQAAIADSFSTLWLLTYTNDTLSVTNSQPFTFTLQNTTRPYTNRITQAVLSNDHPTVTAVLETPYSDVVDWGDAVAWARYFQELFKTSASQFSEYEKCEISPELFTEDADCTVFHSTNTLVYFPYVVTNLVTKSIIIRFSALEGEINADGQSTEKCAAWLRPMVTVSEIILPVLTDVEGIPEVVDEALLIRNGTETAGNYKRWDKPGSVSIDDPRDNAWADRWSLQDEVPATMGKGNGTYCNVAELPFIHYDRPFLSIGELGYINVDLTNRFGALPHPSGQSNLRRDTIDLSTRSGASLLDKFCTGGVSNAVRGLVQANTTQGEVIRRVLNQIQLGWPKLRNADNQDQGYNTGAELLTLTDSDTDTWIDHWTNTLFKAYDTPPGNSSISGMPGWSCFADMLPDLSTNALNQHMVQPLPAVGQHDYLEDVMRGIVDKVSFRQNIFVIIVAAQTLSPASTDTHPITLADQRAAVTVIRDAYTGKWLIHSWVWLTE